MKKNIKYMLFSIFGILFASFLVSNSLATSGYIVPSLWVTLGTYSQNSLDCRLQSPKESNGFTTLYQSKNITFGAITSPNPYIDNVFTNGTYDKGTYLLNQFMLPKLNKTEGVPISESELMIYSIHTYNQIRDGTSPKDILEFYFSIIVNKNNGEYRYNLHSDHAYWMGSAWQYYPHTADLTDSTGLSLMNNRLNNSIMVNIHQAIGIFNGDNTNKYGLKIEVVIDNNISTYFSIEHFDSPYGGSILSTFNFYYEKVYILRYFEGIRTTVEYPLWGSRFLNMVTGDILCNGWFNCGFLNDIPELTIPPSIPISDEDSRPYWTYIGWEIGVVSTEYIVVGDAMINWTYAFNITEVNSVELKFHYDPIGSIDTRQWGDWGVFNFLRDGLAWILSLLWFIGQYLIYILVVFFVTVLYFLLLSLLCYLIWNILVYWLLYGINWIGYGLVWVLINLPVILSTVIAAIVAGLIFALSFGTLDFVTIYNNVNSVVLVIVDVIVEYAIVFFTHIDAILLFVAGYVTLIGLLYLKIFYCRGRGYTNRAKKLQDSAGSYMKPVKFVLTGIVIIKEAVMPTTGGNESDTYKTWTWTST
ncbi:MAG: hypothetical protein PHW73_04800 [Atribacterota bacterium]|nr:hypothetical protein [Atribacterota bacterium]